ncbi:hypothetical protein Cgig2_029305 [Carnegiea gigantea]|uniref:DUF642 domain-containing protein n=1 Tax=Carnegiea gigantea TaxID=171969 RepID=A0A9Q1KW21_9CARY|nr:hypothetical protein Cgig2_029305 [Carnegiea gigantea]
MILIIPGGTHAVRLGNDAQICQDLKVEKGSVYAVTFSAARTCAQLESLNVSVGPAQALSAVDLQTVYTDHGILYAWAFEGQEEDPKLMIKNPVRCIDSNHSDVPQEKRAIELLSGKEGIISQMVDTTLKKDYTLSFSMGQGGDKYKEQLAIMAFAGDQAQNFHYLPDSNSTFQRASLNFTAKAERTRIAFYRVYYNTRSDHMSSLCGPVLDYVRVWGASRSFRMKVGVLSLAMWVVVSV